MSGDDDGEGSMTDFDPLKLENQLCFPLYAVSRDIVRRYTPLLRKIGLTYTQYIAMMVMWEAHEVTFRDLGKRLHLDSGTLTPLLKKMQDKGLVLKDEMQTIEGITIYPNEYFNPFDDITGVLRKTANTRCIHWYAKTWTDGNSRWKVNAKRLLRRFFGTRTTKLLKGLMGG